MMRNHSRASASPAPARIGTLDTRNAKKLRSSPISSNNGNRLTPARRANKRHMSTAVGLITRTRAMRSTGSFLEGSAPSASISGRRCSAACASRRSDSDWKGARRRSAISASRRAPRTSGSVAGGRASGSNPAAAWRLRASPSAASATPAIASAEGGSSSRPSMACASSIALFADGTRSAKGFSPARPAWSFAHSSAAAWRATSGSSGPGGANGTDTVWASEGGRRGRSSSPSSGSIQRPMAICAQ